MEDTLSATKPLSPIQVAYNFVYHDQVQRPAAEHDFTGTYLSASTSRTRVDCKMVNLHAYLRCVCVSPVKCEMAYKINYGKVSGGLRKSVDLGGRALLCKQETRAAHFLPV